MNDELAKGVVFRLSDQIEYIPHSIAGVVLLKKVTGIVKIYSVDAGKTMPESTSPFDTLLQILDGTAEVMIEGHATQVTAGQAIIVPAHTRNSITAQVRFKMTSTVIKSGYEEIT
jgi:quercetin dioxygenase-like cupin family protein